MQPPREGTLVTHKKESWGKKRLKKWSEKWSKKKKGMKDGDRWENRRWERWSAKKWRSQQIEIMLRECEGGLESLVRGAEEEEEQRWENICSLYLLRSRMHDHNPLTVPLAFCASLNRYVSLPSLVSFLVYSPRHCPPPSSITSWCLWHSDNCLYPLGWGSGCDKMLCTTSPYVGFSEHIHSYSLGLFVLISGCVYANEIWLLNFDQ